MILHTPIITICFTCHDIIISSALSAISAISEVVTSRSAAGFPKQDLVKSAAVDPCDNSLENHWEYGDDIWTYGGETSNRWVDTVFVARKFTGLRLLEGNMMDYGDYRAFTPVRRSINWMGGG